MQEKRTTNKRSNRDMKKLEIKHLAPYLPYGLKIGDLDNVLNSIDIDSNVIWTKFRGHSYHLYSIEEVKPILRPLSDLTKEIEHNGERFVPIDWLNENKSVSLLIGINTNGHKSIFNDRTSTSNIRFFEYCVVEKLIEWHFDVFDLLKHDLAIDINTLEI